MRRFIGLLGFALLSTGCSVVDGGFTGGGDFGATPGGVQDMQFARELVEKGMVPPPEAILVEAMFSEHDLPVAGPPCAETLCLRGAVGVAPGAAGAPAAWAHIGLSSTINPETFQRPPLAIVATVDVSGSMSWDYEDNGTPGSIARRLLEDITAELEPTDQFAMVTYGSSVSTPVGWTYGADPAIQAAIGGLHEDGSTNMEAGLDVAFDLAQDAVGKGMEVRVLLFTDAQPNVGETGSSEFEGKADAAAKEGVGLTVLGLGLGLGADLMKSMSHLRGGNAFSLMKRDDVSGFMADNWPWFTVPIAHDLSVQAQPTAGLSLTRGYGFPETSAGQPASLEVASVFLSKRRGALLLELGPNAGHELAAGDGVSLSLSYEEPSGTSHQETLAPAYDGAAPDERGVAMPQPGTARTVSLALFTSAMRDAAEIYADDKAAAISIFQPALERLTADAAATGDDDLAQEAEFWAKLLELMQSGAQQGDMYSYAEY
jgi:Ca-activated chloride channel homolog